MKKYLLWTIPIVFCLVGLGIGHSFNSDVKNFAYLEVEYSEKSQEYYVVINNERVYIKNMEYEPFGDIDEPQVYSKQKITVYDINNVTYYTNKIVSNEDLSQRIKSEIIVDGFIGLILGLVLVGKIKLK